MMSIGHEAIGLERYSSKSIIFCLGLQSPFAASIRSYSALPYESYPSNGCI